MYITGNRASNASLLQTKSVDYIRVRFVLIEKYFFLKYFESTLPHHSLFCIARMRGTILIT